MKMKNRAISTVHRRERPVTEPMPLATAENPRKGASIAQNRRSRQFIFEDDRAKIESGRPRFETGLRSTEMYRWSFNAGSTSLETGPPSFNDAGSNLADARTSGGDVWEIASGDCLPLSRHRPPSRSGRCTSRSAAMISRSDCPTSRCHCPTSRSHCGT
jgi:hypothetical protein